MSPPKRDPQLLNYWVDFTNKDCRHLTNKSQWFQHPKYGSLTPNNLELNTIIQNGDLQWWRLESGCSFSFKTMVNFSAKLIHHSKFFLSFDGQTPGNMAQLRTELVLRSGAFIWVDRIHTSGGMEMNRLTNIYGQMMTPRTRMDICDVCIYTYDICISYVCSYWYHYHYYYHCYDYQYYHYGLYCGYYHYNCYILLNTYIYNII